MVVVLFVLCPCFCQDEWAKHRNKPSGVQVHFRTLSVFAPSCWGVTRRLGAKVPERAKVTPKDARWAPPPRLVVLKILLLSCLFSWF